MDTAMVAATEAMEATAATTERGRLRLHLRLGLLMDTAMVAATEAMEATAAPTEDTVVFLLTVATDAPTEDMVATDVATTARGRLRLHLRLRLLMDTAMVAATEDMVATDVATTARGKLRLLLRLRLLMDTAMVAATEATEAMEATAAPMEDTVATGPMAAMVALTGMATESRQQLEHRHHMNKPKMLNM